MKTLKPVSFCGINFKNSNHLLWFLATLAFLVYAIYQGIRTGSPITLITYRQAFVVVALAALILTRGGRQDMSLFSRTCIWWNLAVASMCYGAQKLLGF